MEAIPTRRATDAVIMNFLEDNIISRFGCPARIVADNAQAFKSARFVNFCQRYNIVLTHSTAYYPQGNGLAESSNKSLSRIIKKLLEENKKSWDSKLKFALWTARVTRKKSIGTSPFKLVYGIEAIFPIQLVLPVTSFLQEIDSEPDDHTRRIFQLVEL